MLPPWSTLPWSAVTDRPIPLKRFGKVEEIAAMVRLLVGPEGTFITGQTIHVNGGEFLT